VTTPSSEMTKGYTDTLLILQIIFISRVKFSYFVIFSASVWEGYGSRELLHLLQMLFCSLWQWALYQVCWHLTFYQLRQT